MKVLALGAHADDVELGCGGALLRHAAQGDEVSLLVVTHSGYHELSGRSRDPDLAEAEARENAQRLGARLHLGGFDTLTLTATSELVFAIARAIHLEKPDRVYTHYDGDTHLDHAAVALATLVAAKHVAQLLMYRSNANPLTRPFAADFFIDITGFVDAKAELIATFASEGDKVQRWIRRCRAQAVVDGATAGVDAAEGFRLVHHRE